MKTAEFDYDLPSDRIAQQPAPERDASRLLVLHRSGRSAPEARAAPGDGSASRSEADDAAVSDAEPRVSRTEPVSPGAPGGSRIEHAVFRDLDRWLRSGDLLVLNDTRVIPARLLGTKKTGGRIEILLVEPEGPGEEPEPGFGRAQIWICLARFSRAPAPGSPLDFGPALAAQYLGPSSGGRHRVALRAARGGGLRAALGEAGHVALPPYIVRNGDTSIEALDRERYQTVYAVEEGAVAAPTAGLHFTTALLERLAAKGVRTARVTLHVGPPTFQPVRQEEVEDHPIASERYEVSATTAGAVASARARGTRVVAVGTTVVRALESAADGRGGVVAARGRTDLFIYPGYRFRVVDALVTNFHLPRSTLLMLVSAFAGRESVLAAYREGVERGYRFFSYGDAMLIL